jgi:hypothetical protein
MIVLLGLDGGSVTAPNTPAVFPQSSPKNSKSFGLLGFNNSSISNSLPPRSPANSPAVTQQLAEYNKLTAQSHYTAPPNSAVLSSKGESLQLSPKTPINTPRQSFSINSPSLSRQSSSPINTNNAPTPLNSPMPFINKVKNNATPANTPSLGPLSPSKLLRHASAGNNSANKAKALISHTRASSRNSLQPSASDLAKLAVLNRGINVETIEATLAVPDQLVEELKVRPKGDDIEWSKLNLIN